MLFSNWIITEKLTSAPKPDAIPVGICLDLQNISTPFSDLLHGLQQLDAGIPFSILITDKVATIASENPEVYLDNLLSLFFQPGFYIKNEGPVIFNSATGSQGVSFINALEKECVDQGYKKLYTIRPVQASGQTPTDVTPVAYDASLGDLDIKALTDKWINNCFEDHNQWPITLLVAENPGQDRLGSLLQKQKAFMAEKQYKIANALYEVIEEKEKYKFQLYLKGINEQNNQAYLEFQKQDLAKILDFYKYEYEILPLWYKRLGQIIKVILGKRTFKSLFSDNVKKYNKT